MMKDYTKIGLAFLAGAAIGAIAGILFAPDKGSETRSRIAKKAGEFSDAVKEKTKEGWRKATDLKDRIVYEAEELVS